MANIFIIPSEIMFSIFQYLHYQDLMTTIQVCKEWRKIGTDSILWKNFSLVKKDHCLESIGNILKIPRLQKTRKIEIWGNFEHLTIHHEDVEKNSFLLSKHFDLLSQTNIKEISFHNCILTGVDPLTWARFIRYGTKDRQEEFCDENNYTFLARRLV